MKTVYEQPKTSRGKTVFFLWHNLPRLILLSMLVLITVLVFAIIGKKGAIQAEQENAVKQERPPINTVVMTAVSTTISNRLNLPGTIEPWTRLELNAKIAGTVGEVLANEGDSVKKGDVLMLFDDDDYRIALDRARAAYKLAKADYERDKAVYAKGVIPPAEIDARETRMHTAKADLDNAQLLFDRCTVKAPLAGVIRRLDAKVGMFLGVGDPIGRILQIDKVKGVIGIPESDITAVRRLEQVELTIQALGETVSGRRHFISSSPETAALLYRLELKIDNHDHRILPGMFLRADIVKQQHNDILAIPFYSIISRNNEQYVFIEKDGVAKKRQVKTGIMEKWMVEITSGLNPGDHVVIEGHRDVEDGRRLNVVKVVSDPEAYIL